MAAAMDANQLMSGAHALGNTKAEDYVNVASVEMMWAKKAFHHAETYFNLLMVVDPKLLKLTPKDDEIYKNFRKEFPKFKVDKLDEDSMKSKEGKAKWRAFCDPYKGLVDDFNMGSLVRNNCEEEYSESNSVLVPRVQFLAIEIARNREGNNSGLAEKFSKNKT